MLEKLEASPEQSAHAIEISRANIEWQTSDAAIVIINRFLNQRVTEETEPPTTNPPPTTDRVTTQAACNVMLSTSLGLLCVIMRLML